MVPIGAEAAVPGSVWCVSVVALTQEEIPVPAAAPGSVRVWPGLTQSAASWQDVPALHRVSEMGGYLLTYAL